MIRADDFVNALLDAATKYKTLYVMGCIGAPITSSTAKRYINDHSYNQKEERKKMITEAIDKEVFGFDCICLIKSILWGWRGDVSHHYGGAVYRSNGVDDISLDKMLELCKDVSESFENIEKGEYLWMDGHCGIYVGNGLAVECTPKWDNKVQITAVYNMGKPQGYNGRTWSCHGKLPYVDYGAYNSSEDTNPHKEIKEEGERITGLKGLIKLLIELLTKLYNSL